MLGVSLRFPISRNDFQRVESSLGFHFHAPFDSAILLFHAIAFFIFLESVITRAASSASAKREREREREGGGERERERERESFGDASRAISAAASLSADRTKANDKE